MKQNSPSIVSALDRLQSEGGVGDEETSEILKTSRVRVFNILFIDVSCIGMQA